MKKIELLSPAGDLERLKIALIYGADAVYIGGKDYSLRANANNFSIEEIKEACDFAHNFTSLSGIANYFNLLPLLPPIFAFCKTLVSKE